MLRRLQPGVYHASSADCGSGLLVVVGVGSGSDDAIGAEQVRVGVTGARVEFVAL